ncbi:hypothetical protein KKG58_05070, partial [Patescibacteria group bacterium]|nr:hypothetical protein [Patescibacteria group bacterium]
MGIKFSQKSIEKSTDNFLLEGPELVDAEQEKKEENNLCFTFSSNNREYYLKNKNGQTIFSVKCYDDLPDELTDEERSRFIKEKEIINGKGRDVYILESDKTLKHNKEKKNKTEQNKEYHVSKPRDFQKNVFERFVSNISNRQVMSDILSKYSNLEDNKITELTQKIFNAYKIEDLDTIKTIFDQFSKNTFKKIKNDIYEQNKTSPEEINIPKVVELLKNKKVLFYTGAGMSISGGVPGMEDLHNNLEIDMSKKIDGFLKNSINNPKKVIKDWQEFIDSCFDTQDTDAHKSLAYL